jgi:formate dehydrogenase major subunit
MDACRCAKRLGAEKVTVVYRRTRAEMPADPIEVEEAMEEGIEFVFLAAPQAVEGSGKVERMVCEQMELGEPDASGRRRPVATGKTFILEVDQVIAAIGQQLDPKGLPKEIMDGKWMIADDNYATPMPGVFVTGDQKTGPDIAIAAIGTGHWAAESAHHYITKGTPKAPFEYDVVQKDLTADDFADQEKTERQHAHHDAPEVRMQKDKIFEEYNHGLTKEQTLKDAERCMECGCPDLFECKLRKYAIDYEVNPDRLAGEHIKGVEEVNEYYVRNMDKCILCGRCIRACNELAGFHAIDFTNRGFAANVNTPYWQGIEASECTQCGLCVQLCPVGALLEKRAPRWPHSEVPTLVPTACGQCSVGCQIDLNLDAAKSRIVRITSDLDNPTSVTSGVTCAKGRFDFAPLLESRLEAPLGMGKEMPWNKALDSLKEALGKAGKVGVLAGDALSNQEYHALKRFAGEVLEAPFAVAGTDAFAPARKAMMETFGSLETGVTYGDLQDSDAVLLLEADLDAQQPALVSLLRRGMRNKKTRMIFLGGTPGMLERGEAISLQPREGSMTDLLKGFAALTLATAGKEIPEELKSYTAASVAERTGVSQACLEEAAKAFGSARKALALLGSLAGACPEKCETLAKLLGQLNQKRLVPLYKGSNLGGAAKAVTASVADVVASVKSKALQGLVLVNLDPASVGLTPEDCKALKLCVAITSKAGADYAAYQLPLANWVERDGTITALSGEQVEQKRSLAPVGVSAELCWILANLSRRLGTELPAAWGAYSLQ